MDCCRNLIITPILIDRIGVSFFTKVNVIILSLAFLNSGHSQSDFNFVDEKVIERFALPLPTDCQFLPVFYFVGAFFVLL